VFVKRSVCERVLFYVYRLSNSAMAPLGWTGSWGEQGIWLSVPSILPGSLPDMMLQHTTAVTHKNGFKKNCNRIKHEWITDVSVSLQLSLSSLKYLIRIYLFNYFWTTKQLTLNCPTSYTWLCYFHISCVFFNINILNAIFHVHFVLLVIVVIMTSWLQS